MHDLRDAVIHLERAGDVPLLAHRQQLFDIAGLARKNVSTTSPVSSLA